MMPFSSTFPVSQKAGAAHGGPEILARIDFNYGAKLAVQDRAVLIVTVAVVAVPAEAQSPLHVTPDPAGVAVSVTEAFWAKLAEHAVGEVVMLLHDSPVGALVTEPVPAPPAPEPCISKVSIWLVVLPLLVHCGGGGENAPEVQRSTPCKVTVTDGVPVAVAKVQEPLPDVPY